MPVTIRRKPESSLLRTEVVRGSQSLRVDREANVVSGVNLFQAGELNDDRPWTVDAESLSSAFAYLQEYESGAKARFTHPNMSGDGLGSYLGRWQNFRIEGEKLVADLHLAETAFTSPQGDLGTYVLDMAEHHPDMFGVSLATKVDFEAMDDLAAELEDDARIPIRFSAIRAADVVDEPAATRGGLFDVLDVDNRKLPAQATLLLDSYFSGVEPEVVSARINGFLATYFRSKGKSMPETNTPEETPESTGGDEGQDLGTETVTVDLEKERETAADLARQEERDRITRINALCEQAGSPNAHKFAEQGLSVEDVQSQLFMELCNRNKPVGDDGDGSGSTAGGDGENAKYVAEFNAEPEYAKQMSLEDYVALRRVDDGLDVVKAPMNVR